MGTKGLREGDTVLAENAVKYLIQETKAKYQYWQKYATLFDKKIEEIESEKQEVAKMMMENPDSEESKAALMFARYDFSKHVADINSLVDEYVIYYKMCKDLDLTDHFPSSQNKKSMKALESVEPKTFYVDGDSLEEIVKGGRKKFLEQIEKNPELIEMANKMAELLSK